MASNHHEATVAAMEHFGCYRTERFPGYFGCGVHRWSWSGYRPAFLERGVCAVINSAVRIGYEAGRRDALTEAADAIEAGVNSGALTTSYGYTWLGGVLAAEHLVRSLLTEEADRG